MCSTFLMRAACQSAFVGHRDSSFLQLRGAVLYYECIKSLNISLAASLFRGVLFLCVFSWRHFFEALFIYVSMEIHVKEQGLVVARGLVV